MQRGVEGTEREQERERRGREGRGKEGGEEGWCPHMTFLHDAPAQVLET